MDFEYEAYKAQRRRNLARQKVARIFWGTITTGCVIFTLATVLFLSWQFGTGLSNGLEILHKLAQ